MFDDLPEIGYTELSSEISKINDEWGRANVGVHKSLYRVFTSYSWQAQINEKYYYILIDSKELTVKIVEDNKIANIKAKNCKAILEIFKTYIYSLT